MRKVAILFALLMAGMVGLAQPAMAADRQPPTIKITRPTANAVYNLDQVVKASYSCSDNRRVVSCVGSVANGANLTTSTAGKFTFTVNATDNAGNKATKSVAYTVQGTTPPPPPPPPSGTCANYYGLTFDDGPNAQYTKPILDILKANSATATFFETGENIAANPSLTKLVSDSGYSVQNHTYTHPSLPTLSASQISSELTRTSALILQYTGKSPTLVRPPYGDMNNSVLAVFQSLGLEDTLWTTDTNDWDGKSVAQIVHAALTVPPGGNILMHDAYPNTVTALPQIIQQLRTKGFCPGKLVKSTRTFSPWEGLTYHVEAVAP